MDQIPRDFLHFCANNKTYNEKVEVMAGAEKEGERPSVVANIPAQPVEPVTVEQSSPPKPRDLVLNIEPGKYTITVGAVTAVSTTANASFDKLVSVFSERIRESAAKTLGEKSIPDEPSAAEER